MDAADVDPSDRQRQRLEQQLEFIGEIDRLKNVARRPSGPTRARSYGAPSTRASCRLEGRCSPEMPRRHEAARLTLTIASRRAG
jgi:hypothetical protein